MSPTTPPHPHGYLPHHRDYLTSLPAELLTKILSSVPLSSVPLSSFLDLTHTSRGLRHFIKANAAAICNTAIESRFAYENKPLKPTRISGWLAPTDSAILDEEQGYKRITKIRLGGGVKTVLTRKCVTLWDSVIEDLNIGEGKEVREYKPSNLLGELDDSNPLLGLTTPGPQYLFISERVELLLYRLPVRYLR